MSESEHAFVLSGGGASGAYEIGVMKALLTEECDHVGGMKIDPGIYTGTSVGSFNAAFMASPKEDEDAPATVERLGDVWTDVIAERPENCGNGAFRIRGNALPFLRPKCLARHPARPFTDFFRDSTFLTASFARHLGQLARGGDEPWVERLLEFPDLSAFISTEPLRNLVRDYIDLKRLRASDKKMRAIATDWIRGKPLVFTKTDMNDDDGHKMILASTAIPGVFPPIEIGDDVFVDGGVTMNTPLSPAITAWREDKKRADNLTVHVVYVDTEIQEIPLEKVPSTFATANRFFLIVLAYNIKTDVEYARQVNARVAAAKTAADRKKAAVEDRHIVTVHRYRPKTDLGGVLGLLDFRRDRLERLIDQGFKDTAEHDCEKEGCVLPP